MAWPSRDVFTARSGWLVCVGILLVSLNSKQIKLKGLLRFAAPNPVRSSCVCVHFQVFAGNECPTDN
jgi:hypothetical protein